jgi:hypothetical protein
MDVDVNSGRHVADERSASGAGLDTLIKTPFFIVVGIIVVLWETISGLLRGLRNGVDPSPRPRDGHGTSAPARRMKVPMMPIDNYSQLDVTEVIARLEHLGAGELAIVRNYESDHANRQTVLDAIDQRLARIH